MCVFKSSIQDAILLPYESLERWVYLLRVLCNNMFSRRNKTLLFLRMFYVGTYFRGVHFSAIYKFCTIVLKGFKIVGFIKIGQCPLMHKSCLACLLNFAEQAGWAELVRWEGLSEKIFNIVATPSTTYIVMRYFQEQLSLPKVILF